MSSDKAAGVEMKAVFTEMMTYPEIIPTKHLTASI